MNCHVFKDIEETNEKFRGGAKGCFGRRRGPEATFRLDLRPDFRWPQAEVAEKKKITGDGASEWSEEKRISGGSDPTLSGLSAAQRLRRRGSLPPKLSSRFPRSVAGRVAGEAANRI